MNSVTRSAAGGVTAKCLQQFNGIGSIRRMLSVLLIQLYMVCWHLCAAVTRQPVTLGWQIHTSSAVRNLMKKLNSCSADCTVCFLTAVAIA
jgi:hypothetical protein